MNKYRLLCFLFASICSAACVAAAPPVLVISVDGLHPAYVTEADRHGLKVPALRRMLQQGAHARGVVGVVPTVTYPSHTTLMTGVTPQEHGIISNTPFDPLNVNKEGWYWYAEDIKAKTLWEVAADAGLRTASVNWPVTVGDRHISFLLPEYWRASTGDDLKLMRQLDRPEDLMEQLEAKLGPFVDGYVGTVESDWIRTRFTIAILRERKPQFMATHIIALDEIEHERGPFGAPAFATLEQLDKMIGEMMDAARRRGSVRSRRRGVRSRLHRDAHLREFADALRRSRIDQAEAESRGSDGHRRLAGAAMERRRVGRCRATRSCKQGSEGARCSAVERQSPQTSATASRAFSTRPSCKLQVDSRAPTSWWSLHPASTSAATRRASCCGPASPRARTAICLRGRKCTRRCSSAARTSKRVAISA